MRTTIVLDDDLHAAAKRLAVERGTTLAAVIDDALRETLARRAAPSGDRFSIKVVGGHGPRPGVDITDNAALRDLIDEP